MFCDKLRRVLMAGLVTLPAGAQSAPAAPDTRAASVIATIAKIEPFAKAAHFVSYDGTFHEERFDAASRNWVLANDVRYSFAVDGIPGGRCRFQVTRGVVEWLHGAAPYLEEAYVTTYDGRVGQTLHTPLVSTGGAASRTFRPYGSLEAKRPNLVSEWATSAALWNHTLYGVGDKGGEGYFSDLLRAALRNSQLTTRVVPATGGVTTIEFRVGSARKGRTWICDENRNFAIVRTELDVNGVVRERTEVDEWHEVGGLFIPRHARLSGFTAAAELTRRGEYSIMNPVVSNQEPPSGLFGIEWPENTAVADATYGKTQVVGPTEAVLIARVEAMVSRARGESRSAVEAIQGDVSNPGVVTPARGLQTGAAVAAIAAVVALCLLLRRRARGVAAVVLLSLSAMPAPAQAGLISETTARLPNCGLNAALFVLRYYERSVSVDELGVALGVGRQWERAPSLLGIKGVFETSGLCVAGFDAAVPNDALRLVRDGSIAVIHTKAEAPRELGHFWILVATRQRGRECLVVNPTQDVTWISSEDFRLRFAASMSGALLRVSNTPPTAMAEEVDLARSIVERDVSAAAGTGEVQISLPVWNRGSTELLLTNAAGTCSCFSGAEFGRGTQSLPPGIHDRLNLRFHGAKLAPGTSTQSIKLTFAGGARRETMLVLTVHRPQLPVARVCQVVPEEFFVGRVKMGDVKVADVTVLVSAGSFVTGAECSAASVSVIAVGEGDPLPGLGWRRFRFQVRYCNPSEGRIDESVFFKLSDPTTPQIRFRIRGVT